MSRIKFSHFYKKLADKDGQPIKTAKLLHSLVVSLDQLTSSQPFMDYDTENGKNRLSHEAFYLLLIFQKPDGDLFTDVRPQWSQYGNKQKYYEDLIGHQFQIEIKEVSNG